MVPKLSELVVTRRTPYIHGIHTNQYYTPFSEKVNVFLLKNPLFLSPVQGLAMCRMSTAPAWGLERRSRVVFCTSMPIFHHLPLPQFLIYTTGQLWYTVEKGGLSHETHHRTFSRVPADPFRLRIRPETGSV